MFCKECNLNYLLKNEDELIHCFKCNRCYFSSSHICIENKFSNNCCICLEDLEFYKKEIEMLNCGHIFHQNCIIQYISFNEEVYYCPLCKYKFFDLNKFYIKKTIETNTHIKNHIINYNELLITEAIDNILNDIRESRL